ncbi:hypothetical protein MKEN_00577300 [Mycena kentingensis (nom. inval.)]|nr:hypothetical protein MKEN_00577300 [Mycena kentingensis (nom. inval.)]
MSPRSSRPSPSLQAQETTEPLQEVEEEIIYTTEESAEAGATKLWAVYVKEAATYDKSLVESWKSDMEGMLIFAGLFSASLTAFIIESYKTLVVDPADTSVVLLKQISLQLANQTTTLIPEDPSFSPSTSALICNVLWFLSLGLSLACALVATLLQQWTREFLHQADARSSPNTRARMYSFLYYGMRDFKMHAVADAIPSLLHASLLLFFAGLVAFLLPVNKIIAGLVASILLLVLGVYLVLTILPLVCINSPYRTPLSNMLWSIVRWVGLHLAKFNAPTKSLEPTASWSDHIGWNNDISWRNKLANRFKYPALVDRIQPTACQPSSERDNRDSRALIWTVRSLSDDQELEAFVEAVPDAAWGTSARHKLGMDYLCEIREANDLHLPGRIMTLLERSTNGLLSTDESSRRQTACYKAIWAFASIPKPGTISWHPGPWIINASDSVIPSRISATAMAPLWSENPATFAEWPREIPLSRGFQVKQQISQGLYFVQIRHF